MLARVFLLVLLTMAWAAGAALAAPDNATNQARLDGTVRYLQNAQNLDGGFGGNAGAPSDPDFSAWVAFALAAAGINPQDQAQPGGVDAFAYLAEHAGELALTTDYERALLVVDASGASPRDFGGVDLVREILARQLSGVGREGAFPHEAGGRVPGVNDTIFAILALSPIAEASVQAVVQRAASWVIEAQNPDGGWPETTVCVSRASECLSDVDVTGTAIEALNAAGRHDTEAQEKAFAYLHKAQDANGGFPEHIGEGEANVASTAWAVQGIWSSNQNPESWIADPSEPTDEPLGYMASLQQPDGHIRWKASEELNGLWMTAEVAPAFAGQWLPPPEAPRSSDSHTSSPGSSLARPPASGTAELGGGGESTRPGGGVIAGGGGIGAPLFSRPQPQSQGRTPGGARLLSGAHPHSRAGASRDRRNPDLPRERSVPTAAREGVGSGLQGTVSGSGGISPGRPPRTPHDRGDKQSGGVVKGVLIGAPVSPSAVGGLAPGAPGLRSAGAGGSQRPWLAIGIAVAIVLLILTGSQLERRRPQVIL